jgi:hypothetical protein
VRYRGTLTMRHRFRFHLNARNVAATVKAVDDGLQRCELLERALDVNAAGKQAADAQAAVDNELCSALVWRRLQANVRHGSCHEASGSGSVILDLDGKDGHIRTLPDCATHL